ncbi:MAG TPA: restriction endonuclease subunit S [Saprospiraceae bacterium]|nr:restriction endonuclease subunit S [Saprospiraceae bacterium]
MKKAYPKYKHTDIPWVELIPSHWETQKGKWLFHKESRPVREEDEVVTAFRDGEVTLRKNRREDGFTFSLKEIGYQGIRKGDLVIHGMDAFAGAIGVSDSDGKSSPVYNACTLKRPGDQWYFCHLIREMSRSGFIQSLAKGIRERSTDFRFATFGEQLLPVPSLPEQRSIAAFLDHKCALIDRFIEKKTRLIELLKEQKQAIINRAVTKGLDSEVPMKPSGIDWLGDIPAHWEVVQLRRLIRKIEQGWSPLCENRIANKNEWGVLKVGCVNGLVFNSNEHKTLPANLNPKQEYEISQGDVLMSRANTKELLGSASLVKDVRSKLLLCDKLYRLHLKNNVDKEFFVYSLRNHSTRIQIESSATGASDSMQNISQGKVLSLWLTIPSKKEQKEILYYINQELTRISSLGSKIEKELNILQEYKITLIAEAVTGKIDVREWQAKDENFLSTPQNQEIV